MNPYDVIVIGNGVMALTTTLALVEEQPGLRVLLVGPSARHLAASPASGAMLGCFGEVTGRQLSCDPGKDKLDLNVAASKMWPEWVENLNQGLADNDPLTITLGTTILLNAKSAQMDDINFHAIKDALVIYQKSFDLVDGRDVPSLKPLDDCRPIAALHIRDEGSIDSGHLLRQLLAKITTRKEVEVIDGHVQKLLVQAGSIRGVELLDGKKISAPLVVIAAGFESQRLLDQVPGLSERIPRLFPGAGTAIILQTRDASQHAPYVLRTPNRSFACGLHVVPRRSGLLYVGATNHVRSTPFSAPTAYDVHFLIECAMEQINTDLHLASLSSSIVGHRPVSIDGFPLVGQTSISGLWLLTGTYREGLHMSPLLCRHVAREMVGKAGLFENSFQPERRPIATLSREEAIREGAKHHMAIAYEHSARMPGGWNEQVHGLFEALFEEFYDQIGSDMVLPVEFLPMILISKNRSEILSFFKNYYSSVAN